MPDVWIPPQMQRITGAPDRVQVEGATVRQVINNLERMHPGIKELLYDEELDDITPGLAVIVDGDVSQLGLMERVKDDTEMHFLPCHRRRMTLENHAKPQGRLSRAALFRARSLWKQGQDRDCTTVLRADIGAECHHSQCLFDHLEPVGLKTHVVGVDLIHDAVDGHVPQELPLSGQVRRRPAEIRNPRPGCLLRRFAIPRWTIACPPCSRSSGNRRAVPILVGTRFRLPPIR